VDRAADESVAISGQLTTGCSGRRWRAAAEPERYAQYDRYNQTTQGGLTMHQSSLLRMQWFIKTYADKLPLERVKVLDVGSYAVNGSYRDLFDEARYEYTGLDMEEGPNVDIVLKNPYDWTAIQSDSFDIVISGQAFEHVEFFWITMEEMTRVLKKDGLLCIIAPNGFEEHRFPVDCYRFFTDGMIALARYVGIEPLHAHTNCAPSAADAEWYSDTRADSMLIARKHFEGAARRPNLQTYQCQPIDQVQLRNGLTPFHHATWLAYAQQSGLRLKINPLKRVIRKLLATVGRT